jgi:hypothetical protein
MPALSLFLDVPGKAANLPLELPRDFVPIGSVIVQPMFVAAAPALGVSTLPELIALAKKRPGEITLCRNRHRPHHASYRRAHRAPCRHQARARALFRRAEPGPQRRDRGTHRRHH